METTWQEQLRTVGLRVTRPRLSVLQVLAERPHADVDTIVTAARGLHPTVSPQAVYGVLEALVAAGLARRIERRVGLPLSAFDVPAMARTMATPPLLLVHDRHDAETGWSDSEAIARTSSSGDTPGRRSSSR